MAASMHGQRAPSRESNVPALSRMNAFRWQCYLKESSPMDELLQ
jgi:hypothetical protein